MRNDRPIKILFLTAEPTDSARLRLGQELRDIREKLQLSQQRENFLLESRESLRPGDITQAIFDVKPHIVHFSGHGTNTGDICLENVSGTVQTVSPNALATLFSLVADQVNCVVLNTCYSEAQAKAIAEHIRFVVGMNQAIGDKAGITFAIGFYKALAAGYLIEKAYKFGCVEIQMQGVQEHLTPILHKREDREIISKQVKWVIVLTGTIDDVDKPLAESIVKHLQQLSGDASLTLHKIEPGSIIITLDGSQDGFEKIEALFKSGRLQEVIGLRVESIQISELEQSQVVDKQSVTKGVVKILFLTAEPTDSARLRLGRELEDIKERLRLANPQGMFVLEQLLSARPKDISQAIQDFKPNIVHFSGHGESTGELCFENELGKTQPVTPEALAALFRLVTAHVNCVVLNACDSDIQALAIVEHIPFVIGMTRAIGDKAAIAFAVGFYKALGANRSIEEAYEFGCVEIQLQGIPEESTPVLRKRIDQSTAMFYLERPTIETRCYEEIKQPGCLIRIKAPENMGKTWLMNRIVAYARGNGYKTVSLSIKGLVDAISSNEETFLRSLCVAVGDELELPNNLNQHWDDKLSCIFNCTMYFQKYLLTNSSPVVLALNYLDLVFEQPAIANNFCNMLRDWHDKARRGNKVSEVWQKLRLIIVHSTEVYASLDINSSPLANVGLVIELPEFNIDQVQRLLNLHQLNLTANQVKQLIDLLGGHPLLLRRACDYLTLHEVTFKKLLEIAPTLEGPFRNHLLEYLNKIENNLEFKTAFRQVIMAENPVQLPPNIARSLHRLGLIKLERNFVKPRCKLYRQFFRVHL